MYKYEIENELKSLGDIGIEYFRNYLDAVSLNYNKIILFKNTNKKYSSYYCTNCHKWHFCETKELKSYKKNDKIVCHNCGIEFYIIYSHNVIKDYEIYVTLIDKNYRNEIILRNFYYKKSYNKQYGFFYESFYEVERLNVDQWIEMKNNTYRVMGSYNLYHGKTRGWQRDRTGFYQEYSYTNVVNDKESIKYIIKDSKYKYSCLDIAAENNLNILNYLHIYHGMPKIELFMKAGCINLVKDLISYSFSDRFTNIFLLNKNEINMLKKYNMNYLELLMFRKLKIQDYDLIKRATSIKFDKLEHNPNDIKVINYLYEKSYRISDYKDYLEWCFEIGMDMNDKRVLYPDNPKLAHDIIYGKYKVAKDKIINENILEYAEVLKKYIFKNKKLIIRPAFSQDELITESKYLNHCVRNYAKKVANRSTSIFFIRELKNEDIPFVTLELTNNKVIQCRANSNHRPEKNVVDFVNEWCRLNQFISCFN